MIQLNKIHLCLQNKEYLEKLVQVYLYLMQTIPLFYQKYSFFKYIQYPYKLVSIEFLKHVP